MYTESFYHIITQEATVSIYIKIFPILQIERVCDSLQIIQQYFNLNTKDYIQALLMINHVLFILLCRRVCEILLFLLRVKMTKCQRDGKDMTKCHSPSFSSLLTLFMALLYFTSTEEINPVLSTSQDHRNDDPYSSLCTLSCVCAFFLKLN